MHILKSRDLKSSHGPIKLIDRASGRATLLSPLQAKITGGGWFVRARARRARSAATAHRPSPPTTHHPQQCGPKRAALARRGGPVTDCLANDYCRATLLTCFKLLVCTRANLLAAKLPDCRANLQRPCRPIQVMSSFKLPELWTRPDSPSPVTRDFKAHCGVALAAAAWAG